MKLLNARGLSDVNVGDKVTAPHLYFDLPGEVTEAHLWSWDNKRLHDFDAVIMGGGGIFQPSYLCHIEEILNDTLPVIIWGAGHNYLANESFGAFEYMKNLNRAKLLGLRDWKPPFKYDWVPCPSCMSPLFDRQYEVKHELAFYGHHGFPVKTEGIPRLLNSVATMQEALEFIGAAEVLLTNSYHGAYWAQLLERKVMLVNVYSSKFFLLKHPVPATNEELWKTGWKRAVRHHGVKNECRRANIKFHAKVLDLLSPAKGGG